MDFVRPAAWSVPRLRTSQPRNGIAPLETFDFHDMLHAIYEPLQWIVPEYLPCGLTLFFARPKVGKSMVSLALSLRMARRTSGGVDGLTLYLLLDDTNERRLQDRTRSLLQGEELEKDRVYGATTSERLDTGLIEQLSAWMADHNNTRLIVIDVYARVKPKANDDVFKSDYDGLVKLQEFATLHNIAIILVHHTRKTKTTSGDWQDEVNGSTGLLAAVDTMWYLERRPNSEELLLHVRGRDVRDADVHLTLADIDAPWRLAVGDVETVPNAEALILAALDNDKSMKPKELAVSTGISDSTIRGTLRRMMAKSLIMQSAYGSYLRVTELQKTDMPHVVTLVSQGQLPEQETPSVTDHDTRVTTELQVPKNHVFVSLVTLVCERCNHQIFADDMRTVKGPLAVVTMAHCRHCSYDFNIDEQRERVIRRK